MKDSNLQLTGLEADILPVKLTPYNLEQVAGLEPARATWKDAMLPIDIILAFVKRLITLLSVINALLVILTVRRYRPPP